MSSRPFTFKDIYLSICLLLFCTERAYFNWPPFYNVKHQVDKSSINCLYIVYSHLHQKVINTCGKFTY